MNAESGKFKCPYCGNNEISGFKYWISRIEFINNVPETKYILYNSIDSPCICNCCFFKYTRHPEDCSAVGINCDCRYNTYYCLLFYATYPATLILYLLFGFWIELIVNNCCKNNSNKYYTRNLNKKNEYIYVNNIRELWVRAESYTENEFKNKYNNKFICYKCKYKFTSFKECIPGYNDEENQVTVYNSQRIMAINFSSNDQRINFPISCTERDIFKNIENRLYEEYPDYRQKKCFFLVNGRNIETPKSIAENKIKNGDNIIVCVDE